VKIEGEWNEERKAARKNEARKHEEKSSSMKGARN
jgi:hypothetical protein